MGASRRQPVSPLSLLHTQLLVASFLPHLLTQKQNAAAAEGSENGWNRLAARSFVAQPKQVRENFKMAVDPDRDREVERTTVVERDSGGGGGVLAIVLLIIVVLVLLWVFRDQLGFGSADTGTDIEVPEQVDVNINQN